jgi:diguanylate cyclase (GGDEF)-like protein
VDLHLAKERELGMGTTRKVLRMCQVASALLLATGIAWPDWQHNLLLLSAFILILVQIGSSLLLRSSSASIIARSEQSLVNARDSRRQVEELFVMTDILQSAEGNDDAGSVLETASRRLLPEYGGALYIFNNSYDRLDLMTCWPAGDDADFVPAKALVPGNCWSLKRGKLHINDPEAGTLCCPHADTRTASIEIPMIARGNVYGLLMFHLPAADAGEKLESISRIARALADSMSLALANINLREKLRNQSLRDPLTGLYNRRYMEDALERYVSIAERQGSPTAVVMIDLDNFKKLNDSHGHAKGDAVLRDVASQLVGSLRPSDVASRYGGEELMVILPNCNLADALLKAEILRARIEGLSEIHETSVSASFGVAAIPDNTNSHTELIPLADDALYDAKQAGRNCVKAAARRMPGKPVDPAPPKLAAG